MTSNVDFNRSLAEASRAIARLLRDAIVDGPRGSVDTRFPHPFSNMTAQDWSAAVALWRKKGAPLLARQQRRACPACGADDARPCFESYDGYPFAECRDCGCWYVPIVVDGALFDAYFAIAPEARRYGDYTDTQASDDAARSADRARFLDYYSELIACLGATSQARLTALDIGCGVGNSIDAARELGIDAEGIETNANALAIARKAGRRVTTPQDAADKKYDIITAFEALEHIADPFAVLKTARARLNEGGLLALTVPNQLSPDLKTMRGDNPHILGGPAFPGHINLFAPRTLTRLLERTGFEVLEISGQFALSLPELFAHHLGAWTGVHDHLKSDNAKAAIPEAAALLSSVFGPLTAIWSEAFAFGPILKIIAAPAGAAAPAGLAAMREARTERLIAALESGYGPLDPPPPARRGRPIAWAERSYADPDFRVSEAGASCSGVEANKYLWASAPIEINAGDIVRLRGQIFKGGFVLGLQRNEDWEATESVTVAGAFAVEIAAISDGEHQIILAADAGGGADADFDRLEIVTEREAPQKVVLPTSDGRRGDSLDFEYSEFADPTFAIDLRRARLVGAAGHSAYLWKSRAIALASGQVIRLRGRLYAGGLTLGLLKDDAWSVQAHVTAPGLIEIECGPPAPGDYQIVIANLVEGEEITDADLDGLEIVAGGQ